MASTGTPVAAAARQIFSMWARDSATDIFTLRWLYVSEAEMVTVSSSTSAASANSAPLRLGTSAA